MTYDQGVPNAAQAPSLFPAQANANFTRMKTLIGADHKFNDTVAADDGYHVVTHWVDQAGAFGDAVPEAVASTITLFTRLLTIAGSEREVLMFKNKIGGADVEGTITGWPVRAAVVFKGDTVGADPFAMTLYSSFNVRSVTRTSTGHYTIAFTSPLPSEDYSMSFSSPQSTGNITNVQSLVPQVNTLTILTKKDGGSDLNLDRISVVIMGG